MDGKWLLKRSWGGRQPGVQFAQYLFLALVLSHLQHLQCKKPSHFGKMSLMDCTHTSSSCKTRGFSKPFLYEDAAEPAQPPQESSVGEWGNKGPLL